MEPTLKDCSRTVSIIIGFSKKLIALLLRCDVVSLGVGPTRPIGNLEKFNAVCERDEPLQGVTRGNERTFGLPQPQRYRTRQSTRVLAKAGLQFRPACVAQRD